MWIDLKRNKHHNAWSFLIDSQEYLSYAIRSSDNFWGLNELSDQIKNIETVIFPGFPYYNSIGAIIKGGICSICQNSFGQCEHIEGIIYWGSLCKRIKYKIVSVDHSAIVTEPKDRRCIINKISTDDGYYRDYITWEKTTEKVKDPNQKYLMMSGVMVTLKELDVF
jgi:hypothetical protein